MPHQPHHQQYGSFASNSPITDGTTSSRFSALVATPAVVEGEIYLRGRNTLYGIR